MKNLTIVVGALAYVLEFEDKDCGVGHLRKDCRIWSKQAWMITSDNCKDGGSWITNEQIKLNWRTRQPKHTECRKSCYPRRPPCSASTVNDEQPVIQIYRNCIVPNICTVVIFLCGSTRTCPLSSLLFAYWWATCEYVESHPHQQSSPWLKHPTLHLHE